MLKKTIGLMILVFILSLWFAATCMKYGVVTALGIWGIAVMIALLILFAVWMIVS